MRNLKNLNKSTVIALSMLLATSLQPNNDTLSTSHAATKITPGPANSAKSIDVVITTDVLNVRAGTSTSKPSVGKLKRNNVVRTTHETKAWYRIKFNGNKEGWISKDYAKPKSSTTTSSSTNTVKITPGPANKAKVMDVVISANSLNVRAGTSTSTTVVGKLTKNTVVKTTHATDKWYRIKFNGNKEGWIHKDYAKPKNNSNGSNNTGNKNNSTTTNTSTNTNNTSNKNDRIQAHLATVGKPCSGKAMVVRPDNHSYPKVGGVQLSPGYVVELVRDYNSYYVIKVNNELEDMPKDCFQKVTTPSVKKVLLSNNTVIYNTPAERDPKQTIIFSTSEYSDKSSIEADVSQKVGDYYKVKFTVKVKQGSKKVSKTITGWTYVSRCFDLSKTSKAQAEIDAEKKTYKKRDWLVDASSSTNIYSNPSTNSKPIRATKYSDLLRICGETKNFFKLKDGGWVSKKNVTQLDAAKITSSSSKVITVDLYNHVSKIKNGTVVAVTGSTKKAAARDSKGEEILDANGRTKIVDYVQVIEKLSKPKDDVYVDKQYVKINNSLRKTSSAEAKNVFMVPIKLQKENTFAMLIRTVDEKEEAIYRTLEYVAPDNTTSEFLSKGTPIYLKHAPNNTVLKYKVLGASDKDLILADLMHTTLNVETITVNGTSYTVGTDVDYEVAVLSNNSESDTIEILLSNGLSTKVSKDSIDMNELAGINLLAEFTEVTNTSDVSEDNIEAKFNVDGLNIDISNAVILVKGYLDEDALSDRDSIQNTTDSSVKNDTDITIESDEVKIEETEETEETEEIQDEKQDEVQDYNPKARR